ncbi:MAG: hypothetical protein V3W44_01975 [Dehalococcoidales bacterium]
MTTNDVGDVALVYYQPTQSLVSGSKTATGKEYVFTTHYVSVAWIDPVDVPGLLAMRKTCCGGTRKKMFEYANQAQVDIWNRRNGDGCKC